MWQWPADDDGKGGVEFYDAESFRNCVEEQHLDPELKALLPKDPPGTRPIEKPAEAALRQRMCASAAPCPRPSCFADLAFRAQECPS